MNVDTMGLRSRSLWLADSSLVDCWVGLIVRCFVLLQMIVGWGNTTVRPPRLELEGSELEEAIKIIKTTLATRPQL